MAAQSSGLPTNWVALLVWSRTNNNRIGRRRRKKRAGGGGGGGGGFGGRGRGAWRRRNRNFFPFSPHFLERNQPRGETKMADRSEEGEGTRNQGGGGGGGETTRRAAGRDGGGTRRTSLEATHRRSGTEVVRAPTGCPAFSFFFFAFLPHLVHHEESGRRAALFGSRTVVDDGRRDRCRSTTWSSWTTWTPLHLDPSAPHTHTHTHRNCQSKSGSALVECRRSAAVVHPIGAITPAILAPRGALSRTSPSCCLSVVAAAAATTISMRWRRRRRLAGGGGGGCKRWPTVRRSRPRR